MNDSNIKTHQIKSKEYLELECKYLNKAIKEKEARILELENIISEIKDQLEMNKPAICILRAIVENQ